MGRFWIEDEFIRLEARRLSAKAIVVYVALCSHADKNGYTFIGQRKLAEELGFNKDTVTSAIKELIASGFVGHYKTGKHRVSGLTIASVRKDRVPVSDSFGPKEVFKEYIKEGISDPVKAETEKNKIRDKFGWNKSSL